MRNSFPVHLLEVDQEKEMGKMEGKNKTKLTNHNLSFLIVGLYKKKTFPKPNLNFFSYEI